MRIDALSKHVSPWKIDGNVARTAGRHLLVTGLGSISPLLLTAIVFSLINSPIRFGAFIEHGEAGICAVAVLLGAGLLISRELTPPFKYRAAFFLATIILWTLAVLLYACVRVDDAKNINLNASVLSKVSILVWSLSLLLSVIVVSIDAAREKVNVETAVQHAREEQLDSLKCKFEEAGDE